MELESPTGEKYYYNSVTELSQWEKPAELMRADEVPSGTQTQCQAFHTVQVISVGSQTKKRPMYQPQYKV